MLRVVRSFSLSISYFLAILWFLFLPAASPLPPPTLPLTACVQSSGTPKAPFRYGDSLPFSSLKATHFDSRLSSPSHRAHPTAWETLSRIPDTLVFH